MIPRLVTLLTIVLCAAPAAAVPHKGRTGIVRALNAQLSAYHPGYGKHSRNVASLAYRTALALGLSRREAKVVEAAGLVHDIGKLDVPLAVLNGTTPTPTPEGKALLDLHPQKGVTRLLAAFPQAGSPRRLARASSPTTSASTARVTRKSSPARPSRSSPASSRSATPTT